ncbi:MAG: hypothetical protein QG549_922 [Patescibacteria group bacterium]|nr:hypothetical protein [Patescibacteria group bacterium]
MDISTVTDVKELKALAYDTLQLVEIHQNNLRMIRQRLSEIEQAEERAKEEKKK